MIDSCLIERRRELAKRAMGHAAAASPEPVDPTPAGYREHAERVRAAALELAQIGRLADLGIADAAALAGLRVTCGPAESATTEDGIDLGFGVATTLHFAGTVLEGAPYWMRRANRAAEPWHLIEHPPRDQRDPDQRAACGEKPMRRPAPLDLIGYPAPIETCGTCENVARQLDIMHQVQFAALAAIKHREGHPLDPDNLGQIEGEAYDAALKKLYALGRHFPDGSDVTITARIEGDRYFVLTVGGRMWAAAEERRKRIVGERADAMAVERGWTMAGEWRS